MPICVIVAEVCDEGTIPNERDDGKKKVQVQVFTLLTCTLNIVRFSLR